MVSQSMTAIDHINDVTPSKWDFVRTVMIIFDNECIEWDAQDAAVAFIHVYLDREVLSQDN